MDELEEIRNSVVEAVKQSPHSGYGRRANNPTVTQKFVRLGAKVDKFLATDPNNESALRLRAQVYENLLDYDGAISIMRKVMKINKIEQKDLKKLAALNEEKLFWDKIKITPF